MPADDDGGGEEQHDGDGHGQDDGHGLAEAPALERLDDRGEDVGEKEGHRDRDQDASGPVQEREDEGGGDDARLDDDGSLPGGVGLSGRHDEFLGGRIAYEMHPPCR